VPAAQTCCGQPAYNSGDKADAQEIARLTIAAFEGFDYVVAPSGSCAGMLKAHYPGLLADDAGWAARAKAFARKVHELIAFLVDVRGMTAVDAAFKGRATYHDSCSGLRELGIRAQPRALLAKVQGLSLKELAEPEACCGFGGLFCVKYGDISTRIADQKLDRVRESGADTLLAGDLGCLMHLAGRLKRRKDKIRVRHIAEVLAGFSEAPGIGEAQGARKQSG
jgi:L-lactate dehydrogenase complex protein LldE